MEDQSPVQFNSMESAFQAQMMPEVPAVESAPVETPVTNEGAPPVEQMTPDNSGLPPKVEPKVETQQKPVAEKVEEPFFSRVAKDLGAEWKSEDDYKSWVEDAKKPKQAEFKSELAKKMYEFVDGAADDKEVADRLNQFAFLHTTDFEGMKAKPEGVDYLLKMGYMMDNPGSSPEAAEFAIDQIKQQYDTDPESDALIDKYGDKAANAAAFYKQELDKRLNSIVSKIHEQRASLKPSEKPDGGLLAKEAKEAFLKDAQNVFSSFKLKANGLEYAMDNSKASELASEKAYDNMMSSLFPEGKISPSRIQELMAMEHFLKNELGNFAKKAIGKGTQEVFDDLENPRKPGYAQVLDNGTKQYGSQEDALRATLFK